MQVVGFRDSIVLSVPLGDTIGVRAGDRIVARAGALSVGVGESLLGRVIDALGRPLDGGAPIRATEHYPLYPPPLNPMARDPVSQPLPTGVRAIDAMLTCGRGQRIGLFGGSGVGKSTLMGMLTRGTAADVIVLALVGERGREVRGFIEHDLGRGGAAAFGRGRLHVRQSAAASAARRLHGDLRCGVFSRQGAERPAPDGLGHALCDGAARGRPRRRRAADDQGLSAVGLRTSAHAARARGRHARPRQHHRDVHVLVDGDDHNEPIADAVRSILDGHIVLSRDLASRHHYPPIDILQSVSRTMPDVTEAEHRQSAARVRGWMAAIRDSEDLVSVGAYVEGSNPRIDEARSKREAIEAFLCQSSDTLSGFPDAVASLGAL